MCKWKAFLVFCSYHSHSFPIPFPRFQSVAWTWAKIPGNFLNEIFADSGMAGEEVQEEMVQEEVLEWTEKKGGFESIRWDDEEQLDESCQ